VHMQRVTAKRAGRIWSPHGLGSGRVLSGTQSSGCQRSREGGLPVQTRRKRHTIGEAPYDHLRISRNLTRVGCSASGSAGGSPDPSGGAAAGDEAAGRPGCIPFEEGWAGEPGSRMRRSVMPSEPRRIPQKVPAL